MTETLRQVTLWKINTDTNETKFIASARATDFEIRMLKAKEETLSFHLKENEKLKKEYIYR